MEKWTVVCVLLLGIIYLCTGQTTSQPTTAYKPIKVTVTFYAADGQPEQRGLEWKGVTNLRVLNATLPQPPRYGNAIPKDYKGVEVATDHNVTSMTDPIFYRLINIDKPEVDIFSLDYFLSDFAMQFSPCSATGFTLEGASGTFTWVCRHFAAYNQPGAFPNGRPPIGYPSNFNGYYPNVIGTPTVVNGPTSWRPRKTRDATTVEEEKQSDAVKTEQ